MLFSSVGYVLLPSASVWANPTGEQVVGGSATFQRDGNKLTVNQATDRLAVNWQTFNIAAGEHTHFNMPSAASIALNRVLGGNPSDIRGMLTGNGTIIVVNSFGISTAPGSVIKTGSFMATTRDINPDQFMHADLTKGINLYGDSTAPILNQGSITAEKGDVFLIAQKVENRGIISAPKGKAALVGTGRPDDKTEVVLHEVGGSGFAVRVTQLEGDAAGGSNHGLPDGEELLNEGVISAAQAELSASGNIYALAIKNSGTVRAKGVLAQADGTVRLDGGLGDVRNTGMLIAKNAGDEATAAGGRIDMTGRNVTASPESIITAAGGELGGNGGKVKIDSADTTIVQGKVDVAAPSASAKGGKVELLGERVGLFDGAKVDASGGAGGGTVLVGGDYLGGQTPSADLKDLAKQEAEPVKNAKATVMADTAEIKADATVNGDGGKVILWSDEYTGFYGELFARGGAEGGDGGFIETSSKDNLQAYGFANASAAYGKAGLWLLDPSNVTLSFIEPTSGGTFSSTDPSFFTTIANDAKANVEDINSSLNSGTSVTIQTGRTAGGQPGNITQAADAAISKTGGAEATLTLLANGSITLTQAITSTSEPLNLILKAGTSNNGDSTNLANASVSLGSNLTLNGGILTIQNAGTGGITQTAGSITGVSIATIQGSSGVITLAQSGNDFGTISGLGTAVSIRDSNGFILGNSTFSQASTLRSGGTISQSGLLTVSAGGLTLVLDTSGTDINLSTAANSITGGVTLGGTQSNIRDLKLRNVVVGALSPVNFASATNLRDLTIFYDNAAFAIPNLVPVQATLRNISITANGGNITQAGGIVASGIATFSSSSGSITLNNALNDFRSVVNATASGANQSITFLDSNDLQLGQIVLGSGTGNLSLTFDQDPVTNAGLTMSATGRIQMEGGTGQLLLTPTSPFTDILLGVTTANANSIAVANNGITITNPGNVRDLFIRNVNSSANFATSLASILPAGTLANLRDVSVLIPNSTFTIPVLDQTSLRDVNIYSSGLTINGIRSINGAISLYSTAATTVNGAVNTFAGDISIRSDGGVTIANAVRVGENTTGVILLGADSDGDGVGTLTLNNNAGTIVGNSLNNSTYTLTGAALSIGATASILQGLGTVNFTPSALDANIGLGTLAAPPPFAVTSAALNRVFTAGTVELGNISQIGDIQLGSLSLAANTFGTLKLVTSGAGSALVTAAPGASVSLRSFGINLTFDTNLDLASSGLILDTTAAGFFPAGGNISFLKQVDSDRTLATSGGVLSLTAGTAGDIEFQRSVGGVNPLAVLSVNQAETVTLNRVTARTTGLDGPGGLVSITANNIVANGNLTLTGVTAAAGPGDAGGQVFLSGSRVTVRGTVDVSGGDGVQDAAGGQYPGGPSGEVLIRAVDSILVDQDENAMVRGNFIALGGNPSGGNATFGDDGIINLSSDQDIVITTDQVATRLMEYRITAGRNLLFAANGKIYNPDLENIGELTGGVSFTINQNAVGVVRTDLTLDFSALAADGELFMASGSFIRTNGGSLEIEDNNKNASTIQLANIDITNSSFFGLNYGGINDVRFSGQISGNSNDGSSGAAIDIYAPLAAVVVEGGVVANASLGGDGGTIHITAKRLDTPQLSANGSLGAGSNTGVSIYPGRGGDIQIGSTSNRLDGLEIGQIFAQAGSISSARVSGARGGRVQIFVSGSEDANIQLIDVSGGGAGSTGGGGGSIAFNSSNGLIVPLSISAAGGEGGSDLQRGTRGTATFSTISGDISLSAGTTTLYGNTSLTLQSGESLILGAVDPAGGAPNYRNLVMNSGLSASGSLGELTLEYGSANRDAQLLMGASSSIKSNGGGIIIRRDTNLAPTAGLSNGFAKGVARLGTVDLSPSSGDAGTISIFGSSDLSTDSSNKAQVDVLGAIIANGSSPGANGSSGYAGGSVLINAKTVSLRSVSSRGGDASNLQSVPTASGGSGGSLRVTADTITLGRDIVLSGGNAQGTSSGIGGGGGNLDLDGDVVLNSGNASVSVINLNTAGGTGFGAGEAGIGGTIYIQGGVAGTTATSNALNLIHGSGAVILGDSSANSISLGELVTAADDSSSTGKVTILGSLDLDTLTTYARGYSIEILGGGAVATLTNFLNTGYVQVGDTTGDVMEFTAGMNTQNGPSATVLAGTLKTSREVSDAGLLFGNVELFKNASLNTFGNTLQVGTLNAVDDGGAGTSPGLTLKGQVGNGIVNFTGAVGASAGLPSALDGQTLEAPGTITLETPVDANGNAVARTSPIIFGQAVTTGAFVQQSGAALAFNGDVTHQGTGNVDSTFADEVSLINLAYADDPDAVLSVSSALGRSVTFNGAVLLESGPIELTGAGGFNLGATGTLDGAQDLFLSGNGTKDFSAGTVGGDTPLGTGFGPAITMSGGQVTFGDLETASGMDSTTAPVVFTGVVILGNGDTATTLDANVTFNGADITSSDGFTVGGVTTVSADSTLSGALAPDNYRFIGNVNGAGSLTLEGLGAKQFDGVVNLAGFSQANGSGTVTFADAVTTSGVNTFNGRVVLDGPMGFTSNGAMTTFGDSASDSLTLSAGGVTLLGTGAYTVNATVNGGSQNLSLDGNTTKTFQAGVSSLGTLTLSAGTANFNSTLGATALSQDAGTLNLSGNVTLAGASTLRAANLAGITWINTGPTTLSGQVTTTGITAMNSSLFTLNFATPLVSSGTRLTLNGNVDLAATATLGGTGAITVNGTVNGAVADTQSLTLSGAGAKTFSSSIGTTTRLVALTQSVGSGLATFGGDISLQSNATFNESIVLNGVDLTSATGSVTFGTAGTDSLTVGGASSVTTDTLGAQSVVFNSGVTLNSRLTVDSHTATLNNVSGSSANLDVTANNLNVIGNLQTGTGVVTLTKRDNTALQVGGVLGDFLTAAEINRIRTSGGLTVETAGNISLLSLGETDTDGITGPLRFNSTAGNISVTAPATIPIFGGQAGTLSGLGNLTTGGFNGLTLRTGGLTYASSGSLSLAELDLATDLDVAGSGLTVTGGISTGGRADLAATGGNITVAGRIVAPTAITVDAGGGYFVNSVGGNPFTSADTRILTRNLFSTFPANGAVTGLSNIFGATSISQVGANSVGIAESLLQGSAGPYVTEFTTGTGQPYILATQNAVPAVMIPMPITVAGAFPTRLTYTQEELELLTPEERSAYEAMQRQQAARVILEQPAGSQGESGVPAEGGTPQAQAPATEPVPPTAQVYLDGKPLAGQRGRNHRNATQFIRLHPERAFVQKSGASWPSSWLEQERMTAEVNVGSLPLAKAK